jgi:hypothetical protein
MLKITFSTILISLFLTNSAFGWVENGQICNYQGKYSRKNCRDPKDAADLQKALDDDKVTRTSIALSNRYEACQFSILKGWSSEVDRLKKKIESEKYFLGLANSERYWANEDIKKSPVLPSETVRSAYETLSTYNGMAADSQKQLALYEWCLQCAMKKPKGEADCK